MGAISLDAEIQGFVTLGIDYLRANIEVLDQIFETWLAPHMEKIYGQREIDRVKRWLLDTDVPVVLSWGLQNAKWPCISIHLAQEQERVEAAALSDQATMVDNLVDQPMVVPTFVPKSYVEAGDVGVITVPKKIDLTDVYVGQVVVDAKGEEYLIVSPVTSDSVAIQLVGGHVDSSKFYIKAGPGQVNEQLRGASSRSLAHVDLGIHADQDYQVVLWIYYLVQWIFFRFKLDMEKYGIQLQTFSGSEFNKDSKFLPNNVYSRWYRYSAQVSVEWTEPWATTPAGIQLVTRDPNGVQITEEDP